MNSSKKSKQGGKKQSPINNYNDDKGAGEHIEELVNTVKNNKFNYGILALLAFLVFLSLYFQYQYERSRLEGTNNTDENQESPYETLGIDYGADIKTVKKAYNKLAVVW
jgi:hypothetical protein